MPRMYARPTTIRNAASQVASRGRAGDSTLVHMNPDEVRGLGRMAPGGKLPRNPMTGLPEAAVLDDELNPDVMDAMDEGLEADDMAMEDMAAEEAPVVVATILKYPDGSYELQEGDAPDALEGEMEGEEGMPPGLLDAEPMGGLRVDYESRGELLNRIEELMSSDMDGGSPRQKTFEGGYNGTEEAM